MSHSQIILLCKALSYSNMLDHSENAQRYCHARALIADIFQSDKSVLSQLKISRLLKFCILKLLNYQQNMTETLNDINNRRDDIELTNLLGPSSQLPDIRGQCHKFCNSL
jgi:hypothetical protein